MRIILYQQLKFYKISINTKFILINFVYVTTKRCEFLVYKIISRAFKFIKKILLIF